MTDTPPSRASQLLETYGGAAVVTFLGLLALEMVILTPLVHYGVDLSPLFDWLQRTVGWAPDTSGEGGQSWFISMGIAYAITRGLKPLQIAAALVLIPVVARWMPGDTPASGDSDA